MSESIIIDNLTIPVWKLRVAMEVTNGNLRAVTDILAIPYELHSGFLRAAKWVPFEDAPLPPEATSYRASIKGAPR